jgi:deoxyribodipyrimidine photo-lyase
MASSEKFAIPSLRLSTANEHPIHPDRDYVLYWMIAHRRTRSNFSLQHAVGRAVELGKPLVIFEPLRARYRWASDRIHRFVIEGMRENSKTLQSKPVTYFPYVEPKPGIAAPLLCELAKQACVVITDEYPCFFLPNMIRAIQGKLPARLELVDSNGIMPLRKADRTFTVAHSYRRWMQKNVLDEITAPPLTDPIPKTLPRLASLPKSITQRWPTADFDSLLDGKGLSQIPIDHSVIPSPVVVGGETEAQKRLDRFVADQLENYNQDRNHPDEVGTTVLSPHLHFGHVSAFELVQRVLDANDWSPEKIGKVNGKINGFWNLSESSEALLDQVLTWREIGFNMNHRHPQDYDRFESLPDWAKKTLRQHTSDPRPDLYSLEQFERAETHDELWNAAQRQIVKTGVMHNYMRMLWGKKILHWTPNPQVALDIMVHLNNKYGLDGRDPNSYSGIFWVLGRYDRAWGPMRDVFGSIRYMTSDSTRKKLHLKKYLRQYSASGPVLR